MIQIDYNRKEKQYTWTDPGSGEIFTFPGGTTGKGEAFRFAVGMLEPELMAAAERMLTVTPQLERRIWRGVELVIHEGVEHLTVPEDDITGWVASSDQYGRYAISLNGDGHLTCQCPDWTELNAPMTASGERVCKHIAALKLYRQVREDRF